jgi:hypothetical protein
MEENIKIRHKQIGLDDVNANLWANLSVPYKVKEVMTPRFSRNALIHALVAENTTSAGRWSTSVSSTTFV